MSEEEWMACTHTSLMILLVREGRDRKLRLFGVACCSSIWSLLTDDRSKNAVEIAERFADGLATGEELITAYYEANVAALAVDPTDICKRIAFGLAADIAYTSVLYGCSCTISGADAVAESVTDPSTNAIACRAAKRDEVGKQCILLRDIFGNPFRPVTLDPAWLIPKVTTLAQTIYNDRAFDKMPELADALQEAGCDNEDVLSHCRGPGPHVKGCWVVDLVLGKE